MVSLLSIHLIGAALLATSLLTTAGVLLTNKAGWYKPTAITVASLTAFAVASGVALSVVTSASFLETCAKAGVYLALAGVAEFALLRRMSYRPAWLPS